MNIKHAREKQFDLETEIEDLVKKFEEDTGCLVDSVDIERINITEFDSKRGGYKHIINQIKTKILL
jgi:hypothetical protein